MELGHFVVYHPAGAWTAIDESRRSGRMNWVANQINELGRRLQDRGGHYLADRCYAFAALIAPAWGAPSFNRGLLAKFERRWPESFGHTLRSTELDPDFAPGWWNLGIAATALGDWVAARRAWQRYGINIPAGIGPLEMALGPVPIRVAPETAGEVLWCDRIDPARAVIRSVPFPDCERAHGDVLLHDGEPKGRRMLGTREVSVFDELALLSPSTFRTFEASLTVPDTDAGAALEALAVIGTIAVEDWSSVRLLCTQCSQGTPHDHHEAPSSWETNRRYGLASSDLAQVRRLLDQWVVAGPGRELQTVDCVYSRD